MPLSPRSYAPNPHIPYVSFRTVDGGTDWANPLRPNYLVDFSCTFIADGVGEWAITLFDPKFTEIEKDLIENYQNGVEFSFGYQHGVQSLSHKGIILDMTLDWGVNGVTLKVNGCFSDYTKGVSPKDAHTWPDTKKEDSKDKPGMKLSDIVKQIAEKNGWYWNNTTIEETNDLPAVSGHDKTEVLGQTFTQPANCGDLDFIRNFLAPVASAQKDSTSHYKVWFDPAKNGGTLYFKPSRYEEVVETFDYLQDRLTEIINLVPRFTPGLFATIAAKVESHGIDQTSKKYLKSEGKTGEAGTEQSGQNCVAIPKETEDIIKKQPATAVVGHVITSKETSTGAAKGVWNANYDNAFFNVDMTIVGHPTKYAPLQCVQLNVQKDNHVSVLTGKYLIMGVTHTITNAAYQTMLRLSRNSTKEGELHAPGPQDIEELLKKNVGLGLG